MSIGYMDKRFFASTRGQIVTLLRKGGVTVDELANELELTDNAVRSQLSAMERDGLVHQAGLRRGASKPAFVYELTRDAERLFPKSDATMLRHLLDVLAARLPRPAFLDVIDRTGQLAVAELPPTQGTLQERVEQSVGLLADLGGLAEVEESDSGYLIRGFSCPYLAAAPGHPAVCELAAALLAEYIDAPVIARCEPNAEDAAPRCLFEVMRLDAKSRVKLDDETGHTGRNTPGS